MAAEVVFIVILLISIIACGCPHPHRRVQAVHPGHRTWVLDSVRATPVSIFWGAPLVRSLFLLFSCIFLPLVLGEVGSISAPPTCFPFRFRGAGLGHFCFVFPCSLVTLMPMFLGFDCFWLGSSAWLCCGGEETSKASSCFLLMVTLQPRIWDASVRRFSEELSSVTSLSRERKNSPKLSLVSLFLGCCSSCCCCSLGCCSFCPDCCLWLYGWCCACRGGGSDFIPSKISLSCSSMLCCFSSWSFPSPCCRDCCLCCGWRFSSRCCWWGWCCWELCPVVHCAYMLGKELLASTTRNAACLDMPCLLIISRASNHFCRGHTVWAKAVWLSSLQLGHLPLTDLSPSHL